jgi:DNA modification methylase
LSIKKEGLLKIEEIKNRFSVRRLNRKYVEFLKADFEKNGYNSAYPVSVTSDGVLWDGNHRVTAAEEAGITEIPHVVEDPANIRQAAHERNRVAGNALPETFVDHAEEIWAMLAEGKTQQAVAEEIGWSIDKIKKYCALEKISPVAWSRIVTEFQSLGTIDGNVDGTEKVPNGTITEGLLRNILPLTEFHQLAIVDGIISRDIKPNQVKNLCKTYSDRESFVELFANRLLNRFDAATLFSDCISGLYQSKEQVEKAVKQYNDEFEKTNSIRVLHGGCLELLCGIDGQSCDALITDPPYMILGEEWDTFESKNEFIEFSRKWIRTATEKIKSTGRIYIFWSQKFMFDFPFDAVSERFDFGNVLVWNYKNNTKPNDQKIYKHTWEPCFYFYGKDAGNLNLPKNAEWNEDMNNYDLFEYAQPQTNFTDKKYHPAQKPEKLINQLVTLGSDVGDTILDCFAGSGTTGVVCKKLKRKAILIEKEEEYQKIIGMRLSNAE